MLADMDLQEAMKNLETHIKSSRFFPTVADICKHDPEITVDYEALKLQTKNKLLSLEQPKYLVSEEERAEIRRKAEAGELDEKYEDIIRGGDK